MPVHAANPHHPRAESELLACHLGDVENVASIVAIRDYCAPRPSPRASVSREH
jgi:hypothetical protein